MSHYSLFVVTPTQETEEQLTTRMEPFHESNGGNWDWCSLGGRWSGFMKPDYHPDEDPDYQKVCWICNGTGIRDDELGQKAREKDPTYTCNSCQGKGKHPSWPTEWNKDIGNHATIAEHRAMRDEHNLSSFAALIDGKWYSRGEMLMWAAVADEKDADEWKEELWKLLDSQPDNHVINVVDCHQ